MAMEPNANHDSEKAERENQFRACAVPSDPYVIAAFGVPVAPTWLVDSTEEEPSQRDMKVLSTIRAETTRTSR